MIELLESHVRIIRASEFNRRYTVIMTANLITRHLLNMSVNCLGVSGGWGFELGVELHPTWHKLRHFGGGLHSQSLDW